MKGNCKGLSWFTHEEDSTLPRRVGGTCQQGEVAVSYHALVARFGQPLRGTCPESSAEWDIEFEDDQGDIAIATIYDWKSFCPAGQVTNWHIGEFGSEAAECVHSALWEVTNCVAWAAA